MTRPYDAADNSARGYDLAVASLRELAIRRGQIRPSADRPDEQRWAAEGDRPIPDLDTVRRAP